MNSSVLQWVFTESTVFDIIFEKIKKFPSKSDLADSKRAKVVWKYHFELMGGWKIVLSLIGSQIISLTESL